MAHPGGRPTTYKPEYCKTVIELMKLGKSWTQVAAHFNATREVLDGWALKNKEFSDAKKKGFELSQAWWEGIAHDNLISEPKGPQLSAALWYMNMKNRFGWRDQFNVKNDSTITIQITGEQQTKIDSFASLDDADIIEIEELQ